ncbi:RHS repeat-associated core domain-containing protein [Pseudomonas sp. CAM1A]|uniref:RHS repeat-associated core domain-containing protein n=1 Tax=Pseudomonas sp. CAM1A TaxID=3231717 RepID=UPI0039C69807
MHKRPPDTLLAIDLQGSVLSACKDHNFLSVAYTAYGCGSQSIGSMSLLAFTGHYQEPFTASYLFGNGYRAYQPGLMRFLSPDNLSPFGKGGVNAYAYCACDPVNYKDASGRSRSLIARVGKLPRVEIEIDVSTQQVTSQQQLWLRPGNTRNLEMEPKTRTTTFRRETFYLVPFGGKDYPIADHHMQELISNGIELKQLATTLQMYKQDPNTSATWINDLNREINTRNKRNQTIVKFGAKFYASAQSPEVQNINIRGDYRMTSPDPR